MRYRYLVGRLGADDPNVRQSAMDELLRRGGDPMPALIDLLDHPNSDIRRFATRELIWLRPKPRTAILPLASALEDEDDEVRCNSAWALGYIGENSGPDLAEEEEAAVRALCQAASDKCANVRITSIGALANFGSKSARTEPALRSALTDNDICVRMAAAWALTQISTQYLEQSLPVFIEGLTVDDPEVQKTAAFYLGELKTAAKDAIPELTKLLARRNRDLRASAAKTLAKLGPAAAAAVPALTTVLESDDDYFVRCDAAEALGQIGPAAASAVPALRDVLNDGGSLSDIAPQAIGRIISGAGSEADQE
ncbi:MAG: HEAT repeat domain-containing protein [Planctomycetota bacterium]|nr:HEAT repeat domain-containing protein [Planctomycetota bacterium]